LGAILKHIRKMHEPRPKRKISSEINIYREACRNLVASHPRLHPNHKVVLMRLTDYVNRRTWDAYVSEQTLAADCGVTTRTVRRAMNAGRRFNIIKRTRRGSTWSGPNHHVFLVSAQDTRVPCTDKVHRTPVAVHRTPEVSAQDTRVLLTSEEHLNNLTAPPSSSLENSDVVASDNHQEEEDSEKEVGRRNRGSPNHLGHPNHRASGNAQTGRRRTPNRNGR
jgi:hypothetical protein